MREPSLNQGDMATADVFRKSEWSYNQPAIPAPGWMRWGVTDNLTVQLDLTAWVFGVPSANFRYSLFSSSSGVFKAAWETMYVYFDPDHPEFQDFNKNDEFIFLRRTGNTGFTKLNFSAGRRWIVHWSLGASYSDRLEIRNENRPEQFGKSYVRLWDPTAMIGLEWRHSPRTALHIAASYGETFFFMENRPRKEQLVYGIRWAPLLGSRGAFWRNLRLEFNALHYNFPDARERYALWLPIYPYAYWQWRY